MKSNPRALLRWPISNRPSQQGPGITFGDLSRTRLLSALLSPLLSVLLLRNKSMTGQRWRPHFLRSTTLFGIPDLSRQTWRVEHRACLPHKSPSTQTFSAYYTQYKLGYTLDILVKCTSNKLFKSNKSWPKFHYYDSLYLVEFNLYIFIYIIPRHGLACLHKYDRIKIDNNFINL